MSSMTDYLEGKVIDHLFRSSTWAKPTAHYFALFSSDPGETGAAGVEVLGGGTGYGRVAVVANDSNFGAPTSGDGKTVNLTQILFNAPILDWGPITHWASFDAPTGGNCLLHGPISALVTINAGDPPFVFMAGDLEFTAA